MIKELLKGIEELESSSSLLRSELTIKEQAVQIERTKILYKLNKEFAADDELLKSLVVANGFFGEDLLIDFYPNEDGMILANEMKLLYKVSEGTLGWVDTTPLQHGATTLAFTELPEDLKEFEGIKSKVEAILG